MSEVTPEEAQRIESLYASIGRIAVVSEHLRHAMENGCALLLKGKVGIDELAETALAGRNLENMRQVWVSMMKLAFRSDDETCGMIDHLGGRIDNIAKRRNDTIHRLWYIGLDDDKDKGLKTKPEYRPMPKGQGGVRVTTKNTRDFEEIIAELDQLTSLVWDIAIYVAFDESPRDHFTYQGNKLINMRGGAELEG